MRTKLSKHFVAIDSETGIVWHDNRALRAQDLVNETIKQASSLNHANRCHSTHCVNSMSKEHGTI